MTQVDEMEPVRESLSVILGLWRSMLLGTGLFLISMIVGLALGRERRLFVVRALSAWVNWIIGPLLRWRSRALRAAAIFANNVLILAAMVALGVWPPAAVAAVALVGVSMGIALRVMTAMPVSFSIPGPAQPRLRRTIQIGVLLNLLEPPAIVAAIGLSLGREPAHLTPVYVWSAFAFWIVPAMAVAAAGESLWIGAGRESASSPSEPPAGGAT